ncbi:ASCH domain-containing protein [Candidatus Nitrosocosmicus franklandus]|uniref:ASCH domain protein n=1 Tax=Candidatus Nitrosocosmicus franklandianus TaxID=1798806 RepID=A0A484IB91_9ARCH|nr:ASCH domain-containing protein [Candidatus Nitrosocosmicus franklandus]VFJ12950.1 ASCH domain protein [Candidatus Nitrosocosmicus franklandus]
MAENISNALKCLSLKQPYAYLLASGKKTIEIRKWNTRYRGKFLIHASKNLNKEACSVLKINEKLLIKGAIIGAAVLYGVKTYHAFDEFDKDRDKHLSVENMNPFSNVFKRRCGFLIKDAVLFDYPVPYSGKLGMFEVQL